MSELLSLALSCSAEASSCLAEAHDIEIKIQKLRKVQSRVEGILPDYTSWNHKMIGLKDLEESTFKGTRRNKFNKKVNDVQTKGKSWKSDVEDNQDKISEKIAQLQAQANSLRSRASSLSAQADSLRSEAARQDK